MPDSLKQSVFEANLALARHGLAALTWGNASGVDRARGVAAIKPSGVPYEALAVDDIVLVRLSDGAALGGGARRPSTDLPTHLALYRAWPALGGVAHTHSAHATAFAQAQMEIPCLGTTHADHFAGAVPLAPPLGAEEVAEGYEANTGLSIIRRFSSATPPISAADFPGVLCAGHGPFTWGATPAEAVENAVALEEIARIAALSLAISPGCQPLPGHILWKHHSRKHGAGAYYGQQ